MAACVCVCLRLLLLWPGPVLAVPIEFYVPACLLQHFPLEMTGLSFPLSRGPVSSPFYYLLAASLHHICPQVVSKVPLTVPFYILRGHPVSPFLPGSFRVSHPPPQPSVKGREAQRRRYKGVFNLAPSPQESLCQPHHILEEEGAPGRGLPYIAAVVHALLEVLGVELGALGPEPLGTQEQRRQLLLGSAL